MREGQTGGENKNTGAAENEGLSSEPAQPVIDPRDFVMEIWNQGILAAACPATATVNINANAAKLCHDRCILSGGGTADTGSGGFWRFGLG